MSGAAEGIAGLALSAISVASLFTTCIQCFDIVVTGKNFSEDYEQLCALFSLQRVRFGLWGETVGLVPNPNNGYLLQYDENLDRPDIRQGVERVLLNIKSILDEACRVDERYGLKAEISRGPQVSSSRGMNIFKGPFERFKNRIQVHQKATSAWNVTRWAIHDADKLESMVNRLEKYVDGLESITKSLGLLQEQRTRLREEIDIISDVESLRLLRDASLSHHSSQNDVSDAASRRLITVAESAAEKRTLASTSLFSGMTNSFVTAETSPPAANESILSVAPHLPGAWPRSVKSDSEGEGQRHFKPWPKEQLRSAFKPGSSCEECSEEHYKCVAVTEHRSCIRCIQTKRECSFLCKVMEQSDEATTLMSTDRQVPAIASDSSIPPEGVPQNQRVLRSVIEKTKTHRILSFEAGDAHYGEKLAAIKKQDKNHWLSHSGKILGHVNSSSSAAKRMFIEIRNIITSKVPFISVVPVNDSLDKVLASIEGPPETPYEGGIFWITVKLSETDPLAPPMMRFHTKVYHPNISPQGYICAEYKEQWTSPVPAGTYRSPVKDPNALWYRPKSSNVQWTLGAILTALCALLANPDVDDPLVPEIAQKYIEDYDGYCENARLYTRRFAAGKKPDYNHLLFLEDLPADSSTMRSSKISQPGSAQLDVEVSSLQTSLREKYDERFHDADIVKPVSNYSSGRTLLHRAAISGHEAAVKLLLLDKDVDVELKDYSGPTPLSLAARNGHEAVVKLLLDKNADVESKDYFGPTPLSLAARNGHEAVVKLLLDKNVDVQSKDYSGPTPLSLAAENGHETVVKLLLDKNADVESKGNSGPTPLSLAAENGHETVVKLLLDKNADVGLEDNYHRTPLSWAAKNDHEAVVKLLLDKNADVESKDYSGRTPLLWAAENGHEAVAKLLLDKNADVESKDYFGRTPLSLATENGHEAVVMLLRLR